MGGPDVTITVRRSPAVYKNSACVEFFDPAPELGPTLQASIVPPVSGPSYLETVSAPTVGPSALSSNIAGPATGPTNISSQIIAPQAGPQTVTSNIVNAPVGGPSNLSSSLPPDGVLIIQNPTYHSGYNHFTQWFNGGPGQSVGYDDSEWTLPVTYTGFNGAGDYFRETAASQSGLYWGKHVPAGSQKWYGRYRVFEFHGSGQATVESPASSVTTPWPYVGGTETFTFGSWLVGDVNGYNINASNPLTIDVNPSKVRSTSWVLGYPSTNQQSANNTVYTNFISVRAGGTFAPTPPATLNLIPWQDNTAVGGPILGAPFASKTSFSGTEQITVSANNTFTYQQTWGVSPGTAPTYQATFAQWQTNIPGANTSSSSFASQGPWSNGYTYYAKPIYTQVQIS